MADKGRDVLEMVLGAMMAQTAFAEFLVQRGVIDRAPLLEYLAMKRVSWEQTATANSLFAIDVLSNALAGRQPPEPPGSVH